MSECRDETTCLHSGVPQGHKVSPGALRIRESLEDEKDDEVIGEFSTFNLFSGLGKYVSCCDLQGRKIDVANSKTLVCSSMS